MKSAREALNAALYKGYVGLSVGRLTRGDSLHCRSKRAEPAANHGDATLPIALHSMRSRREMMLLIASVGACPNACGARGSLLPMRGP